MSHLIHSSYRQAVRNVSTSKRAQATSMALALAVTGAVAFPQPALAASTYGYVWPLETTGTITQNFGDGGHTGTDIAASKGTDVLAMADGEVKYVQSWDGHTKTNMQSYGNMVIVYHPSTGSATYYAHLTDYSVSVGQKVKQGQVIGHVGSTGNSTGNHLHVELRTGAKSAHYTYGKGDGTGVNVLDYVSPEDTFVEAAPGMLAGRWGVDTTNVPTGPVIIKLNGTNLALTTDGTTKGSEVTVNTEDGSNGQLWTFEAQGDGSYKLRSSAGNIVLDIEGGSTSNGANVWTWTSNDATEERFFVEQLDDGTYALRNAKSGLYINIGDRHTVRSGDDVTLWCGPSGDGRSADQTWDIIDPSAQTSNVGEADPQSSSTDSDSQASGIETASDSVTTGDDDANSSATAADASRDTNGTSAPEGAIDGKVTEHYTADEQATYDGNHFAGETSDSSASTDSADSVSDPATDQAEQMQDHGSAGTSRSFLELIGDFFKRMVRTITHLWK